MKKLFYLLSFLLFINNYQSNKHNSYDRIIHILKGNNINPERVPEEIIAKLFNLLSRNKHDQFSNQLEKLKHNLTKSENRK